MLQQISSLKQAQSQIFTQNAYSSTINQISNLLNTLPKQIQQLISKNEILQQSLLELSEQLQNLQKQQQTQNLDPSKKYKKTQQLNEKIKSKKKQIQLLQKEKLIKEKSINILNVRLEVLSLGSKLNHLSKTRLDNLQRVFHHYCDYIFKSGRHVTFDRIQYQKDHLIMQRYFALIHDFCINQIEINGSIKPLIPKDNLILIFKKSSSNARNIQFHQFLSLIERLAVLHYDFNATFIQRKQKQQYQRQKIKRINQNRLHAKQRKQKIKQQEERRKLQQQQQRRIELQRQQQQSQRQQSISNQGNIQSIQAKQQTAQQRRERKKKQKLKKKKKKSNQVQQQSENPQANNQVQNNTQNNDQLLNSMLSNNIQNVNDQFSHLNKYKQTNQANKDPQQQQIKRKELITLSKQQKIQLFYKLIQLDSTKAIQAKLRLYQKPLYKQTDSQGYELNTSSMTKLKATQMKNFQRLGQLKQKIKQRQMQKLKRSMSKSITDQKYQFKKKQHYQKYLHRANSIKNQDLDVLNPKQKTYRKKDQVIHLSLDMLNQAHSIDSLQTFKTTNNPKKYLVHDQDDHIFMKQYGGLDKRYKAVDNGLQSSRNSVDLLNKLKKRADQVESVQKLNQQEKLGKFALQMFKNQHYMKKFMQRKKW